MTLFNIDNSFQNNTIAKILFMNRDILCKASPTNVMQEIKPSKYINTQRGHENSYSVSWHAKLWLWSPSVWIQILVEHTYGTAMFCQDAYVPKHLLNIRRLTKNFCAKIFAQYLHMRWVSIVSWVKLKPRDKSRLMPTLSNLLKSSAVYEVLLLICFQTKKKYRLEQKSWTVFVIIA